MKVQIKTKYMDELCELHWATYPNRTIALLLKCAETGEPLGKATVALEEYQYPYIWNPKTDIAIKDYAENQGMVEGLEEAGIIFPPYSDVELRYGSKVYFGSLTDAALEDLNGS
jgi:hypothetical protein